MAMYFLNKKLLIKVISVVTIVAIAFGVAPIWDFANIPFKASADAPVYDSTLGSFDSSTDTSGNTVLTATPSAGCGFRGWFKKSGEEVSYEETYTLPKGANKNDYVPVFYNFNLNKNLGFEKYAVGTNMKTAVPEEEMWKGKCDGNKDWTTAIITDAVARTGSKSLEAKSYSNATYHELKNLETDTQYTLSFWFYIPPTEDNKNKMNFVSIVGEDVDVTPRANSAVTDKYIACKVLEGTEGICAENTWKNISITFYSDNNTSVKLAFTYGSSNNSGMYIDDVSLTKDIAAAPTYFTDHYKKNINTWNAVNSANVKLSWFSNSWLKVEGVKNGGFIYSAPVQLKKDARYTLKIYANFQDVTDPSYGSFADGNWINIFLTTVPGDESSRYYNSTSRRNAKYNWSITDKYGTELENVTQVSGNYGSSYTGFTAADYSQTGNFIISAEFISHKTAEVYLNSKLNGLGTYYIDKVELVEDSESYNKNDYLKENTLHTVGSAIRTEGIQGLRYKTEIDKHFLTADMPYGLRFTEYGTIAIKSRYLNNKDLVIDGEYDYGDVTYGVKKGIAYSFEEKIDKVFEEKNDTLNYTGVLTNIPKADYNTEYTVRPYFKYVDKNGEEGVIYAPQEKVTVYAIAKAAYSKRDLKNQFVESASVREYLYNNIINGISDKIVKVSNASDPLYNNFQGISSTVYHGVTFFPDSHGRTYTDAQAQTEINRLVDSKVTNVRTRLDSHWMWTSSGWDWNSTKMKAFYKWGKLLKNNGITITINAGWHLTDFVAFYDYHINGDSPLVSSSSKDHSDISEVNYLHGYQDDGITKRTNLYNEDSKASALATKAKNMGLNLTDNELAHYSVAAVRYAEWINQGLVKLKANGVTNVEYVMPFTETGYYSKPAGSNGAELDPTYCYDEWILMTMALQDALVAQGIRKNYKLIGPSQSEHAKYNRQVRFIEYIYEKIGGTDYENMIDINSMHCYPQPGSGYRDTVYDPEAIYANAEEEFSWYNDVLVNAGVRDMEFWCDEYFTMSGDADLGENVGMQATQFAAGLTAGMKNGINRFISWQMFDTLWDGGSSHTTGQFVGGVHRVGTCPSLVFVDGKKCPTSGCTKCSAYTLSSYVPRDTYYGINLIGKYMNNKNAKVFETEILDDASSNGDIYVGAIENDAGKNVILVVNTLSVVSTVEINLEKVTGKSFKRYVYDPNEIVATAEAKSIPSDKTLSLSGTTFYDVVSAQSFAIYVEN